jgi:hypothetical protein
VVRVLLEVVRHGAATRRALRERSVSGAPAAFQAHVADGLAGLLAERAHEIAHRDPHRAADVGIRIVLAALRDAESWTDMDADGVIAELSRALLGYLGADAVESDHEDGDLDFFDVWG